MKSNLKISHPSLLQSNSILSFDATILQLFSLLLICLFLVQTHAQSPGPNPKTAVKKARSTRSKSKARVQLRLKKNSRPSSVVKEAALASDLIIRKIEIRGQKKIEKDAIEARLKSKLNGGYS